MRRERTKTAPEPPHEESVGGGAIFCRRSVAVHPPFSTPVDPCGPPANSGTMTRSVRCGRGAKRSALDCPHGLPVDPLHAIFQLRRLHVYKACIIALLHIGYHQLHHFRRPSYTEDRYGRKRCRAEHSGLFSQLAKKSLESDEVPSPTSSLRATASG